MTRNYQNKGMRQQWTKENMERAIAAVKNGDFSQKKAALIYDVPRQTLRRYLLHEDQGTKSLGRKPELGVRAEQVLTNHLVNLSLHGFSLNRMQVRSLAYKLGKSLGIENRFNQDEELAGWDWLRSFFKRNPQITIRKEENLPINRAVGMNREDVGVFFDLLDKKLNELGLLNNSERIFNIDESGFQLNTKPNHVIAPKGQRVVHAISPKEKGETVTLVACMNAAGGYLPPKIILKGKRSIIGLKERLPPGSDVYMNSRSAYINADLFYLVVKRLVEYFHITDQSPAILIVDGHESHCTNPNLLDFASLNGLTMLCLPPHTTVWIQPADRGLFGPLKKSYYEACRRFLRQHGRSFTKLEFGDIIKEVWGKCATVGLAENAFRTTGIWPVNRDAIPDYAFIDSDSTNTPSENLALEPSTTVRNCTRSPAPGTSLPPTSSEQTFGISNPPVKISISNRPNSYLYVKRKNQKTEEPISGNENSVKTIIISKPSTSDDITTDKTTPVKCTKPTPDVYVPTPRKTLFKISPVPSVKRPTSNKGKKRGLARELTSQKSIAEAKQKQIKKQELGTSKKMETNTDQLKKKKKKAKPLTDEDCSCPVCGGKFLEDRHGENWIRCEDCSSWFHEECSNLEGETFICEFCKK